MGKTLSLIGAAVCAGALTTGAQAVGDEVITIDIGGVNSWDLEGDLDNEVLDFPLDTGTIITGIGWDVTLTSIGVSFASEAKISYADNGDTPLLFLTPGIGDDFPVTGARYFSDDGAGGVGIFKLADSAIPDILISSGILHLEFFESIDDGAGAIDTEYGAGSTLFIQVVLPEGACCLDHGACLTTTMTECVNAGLDYQGGLTDCVTPGCPQPGACCLLDGSCVLSAEVGGADCIGDYKGDDTDCTTAVCPAACAGDASGDGRVDALDILLVISQFGCTGTCGADVNGDQVVDLGDLLSVLSNYGCGIVACASDADCDDGIPCTIDLCLGFGCLNIPTIFCN